MSKQIRVPVPRNYSNIWENEKDYFFDIESTPLQYNSITNYILLDQLKDGNGSTVYNAQIKSTHVFVAMKTIISTDTKWLRREVRMLGMLAGGPHIVKYLGVTRFSDYMTTAIVLEKLDRTFRSFHTTLNDLQIKDYGKQILSALDYIHSNGIIHFDIKPHNIMMDDKTKKLKIIDFGSASIFRLHQKGIRGYATLAYASPENLLQYPYFNYATDVWSFGCILAEMVYQKQPFLMANSVDTQMIKIIKLLGLKGLKHFISKYGIQNFPSWYQGLPIEDIPFCGFVDIHNQPLPQTNALHLIQSMLEYDPENRPTAKEALKHKFFSDAENLDELVANLRSLKI